jgi:asparagine synthase (glutamine-hydrolysing)
MFACAILDSARRRVTLARDPFGIKPLYWVARPGALAFASEIQPLLALPGVERQAEPQRLASYLRFGTTDWGDETLFAGVHQLSAGSAADLHLSTADTVHPRTYWTPHRLAPVETDFESATKQVRACFLDATALHLRADVPIASCLSGGIDSSAIVMTMRHLCGDSLDLRTFSYVAEGPLSEEYWIDMVGGAARARMAKVQPTAREMVADLERLIAIQEEPFISSSIYAQYRVMRLIGEAGVKVVLDGQGADEMLGGYEFYLGARVATLLRAGRLGAAATLVGRSRRTRKIGALRQLQSALDFLLPAQVSKAARRVVGRDLVPDWLRRDWLDQHGAQIESLRTAADKDVLLESLEKSLRGPGLPQLLRYEDRNSMAWSVESRVPFLTTNLVDLLLSLPESFLIGDDGTTKRVFRAAMRGIVPDPVLDRKDKIGFATSEREWLVEMAPWVTGLLDSDAAAAIPALNVPRLRTHWAQILEGRRAYESHVWRWINVIEWTRQLQVHHA